MDLKELINTVNQISEDKGIDKDKIIGAIEDSFAAAYKKEYCDKGVIVRSNLDTKTGDLKFTQIKEVVDEDSVRMTDEEIEEHVNDDEERLPRFNEDRHILVEDANKEFKKEDGEPYVVGDEVKINLPVQTDFGRIAAQTAKQVIIQKLREIERDSIIKEYKEKEGEIVSGVVQRFERGNVFVDLGRVTGIMPYNESIPGEHYRVGERLRFYVASVATDLKTPGIILSRGHENFVKSLFEMEVPEIADGVVEVKAIAREPGSRTKIAVHSTIEGIDPVGSCVGQRGTRVMAVTNELGQEKLDIIEWSEDPKEFVANALSPTKVGSVEISDDEALVLVPDSDLSLAIGKGGQNVRLAAKLTNYKIDVRSQSSPEEVPEDGVATGEEDLTEVVNKDAEKAEEIKEVAEEVKEAVEEDIKEGEEK